MALNTKDFVTLVRDQTKTIQGTVSYLVDFTIGSVLRAIVEANAGVALWLQALILQLLGTTRAATATGSDLDSFMADFGLSRMPAVAATGYVTFSRYTATNPAVIPVGTTVKTSDQTPKTFQVTADPNNTAYSVTVGTSGGYLLVAGVQLVTVPVVAVVPGKAGNVLAGVCNLLTAPIPGVDTVTNNAAFSGGADAEGDAALRVRFVKYIAQLAKATKSAIGYAITSVQPGLSYTLVENVQQNGTTQLGYFYVVVDDGSGNPPAPLLQAVSTAVDAVRPVTSTFGVFGPVVVTATVAMTITAAPGYSKAALQTLVTTALTSYINALPLGASLSYTMLAQTAYAASPGVANVSNVSLNGGTADLTVTAQQVIKVATITVS